MFSYETLTRQKWEQGPGDRDYKSTLQRFQDSFAETGPLTIALVRLRFDENSASADVVGRFAQDQVDSFKTMKFVRDGDGRWRILDGNF